MTGSTYSVFRYAEHKVFVCSLDPTDMEGDKKEMWHNVVALLVLGLGAILIMICLVKYGLRQWREMGEESPVMEENLEADGRDNKKNFSKIQDHQTQNEFSGGGGDHCHCCHECPSDQREDRRRRKRMSNIESKIRKKKSKDSQEMMP